MRIKKVSDLKVIEANDIALKRWNISRDKVVGSTIKQFIGYFNPRDFEKTIEVALTGIPVNFEKRFSDIDSYFSIHLYSPQKNRVALLSEDITEIRKKEITIKESEERYSRIVNTANEGIVIVDENMSITFVNQQMVDISGYTSEELIGKKINDFIFSEDGDYQQTKLKNRQTGRSEIYEQRFLKKDNSIVWVMISATPIFDPVKGFQGSFAMLTDITEQKLAEEKLKENEQHYRHLFEAANDAILIMNKEEFLECNDKTLLMYGCMREEIIHHSPVEFSPEIQPDGQLSEIKASYYLEMAYQGQPLQFEWLHIKKDKTPFHAEVTLNRLDLADKSLLLAIVRDISERKNLEKEVFISSVKGEEKERTRLAKDLHDGLGPLLSACKIYHHKLNQFQELKSNLSYKKLGELLDESMYAIKEISNNLSPHILRNFGLADAIKSFIEKLKTKVNISVSIKSKTPFRISEIVEVSFYRIIIELVNNSLKYANAHNISVHLEYKNNYLLLLEYFDDGIGFNYEETMKKAEGYGLLNIHSRVLSLNGSIEFKSQENKGVSVKITVNI
ncbi:MAG: PAS domain S-box protein [Bacteroidales bacterium]|nr:PAS domain S-box protein [Bacteroidales bacterium]